MSRFQVVLVTVLVLALNLTACSAVEQYKRGADSLPNEAGSGKVPPVDTGDVTPTSVPASLDLPPTPASGSNATPVPPAPTPTAGLPFVPGLGGISLGTPKPSSESSTTPTPNPAPPFISAGNTVEMEIPGLPSIQVVIVGGPAIEIERIPGFTLDRPDDKPGKTLVSPLVFEYSGPQESDLEQIHDDFAAGRGQPRSMKMIVRNLSGEEAFRWIFFEFGLRAIEAGANGRSRYTFIPPDVAAFPNKREGEFLQQSSKNPQTDTRIEIEGIQTGQYPVVETDEFDRTITMTFDFVEGGDIWRWVVDTSEGEGIKRTVSIFQEDPNVPVDPGTGHGREISRRRYAEAFPVKYEQFTGFGLVEKVEERVVLTYSFTEDAR
jgi:hypothetical protein